MTEEKYAIMDDNGAIYRGPAEFIMPIWDQPDKLWDEVKKDKKHHGDLVLVKIIDTRH
jgi:hypothetical protein